MGNAKDKRHLARIGENQISDAIANRNSPEDPLELRRFESDFDQIQKSFQDPTIPLPSKLQEQLNRWLYARQIQEDDPTIRNNRQLAKRIQDQFNVSQTTAYDDIKKMQRLYLGIDQVNADFEFMLLLETTKKELYKASELGAKGQKTVPALLKEMRELIRLQQDKGNDVQPVMVNIEVVDNPELVGGRRIPGLQEKAEAAIAKARAAAQRRFEDVDFDEIT